MSSAISDARKGVLQPAAPSPVGPAQLGVVDRALKAAGDLAWLGRWEAAEEIVRILAQREREWPALIAAGTIDAALAADRTARLACAWTYTVEPAVEFSGPHRYRDDVERALWLAEARGWKPSTLPKGR